MMQHLQMKQLRQVTSVQSDKAGPEAHQCLAGKQVSNGKYVVQGSAIHLSGPVAIRPGLQRRSLTRQQHVPTHPNAFAWQK